MTRITRGAPGTNKVAFAVADPHVVIVAVTPDFEHETVIFTP